MTSTGSWRVIGSSGVVCSQMALLPNSRLLCVERAHESPVIHLISIDHVQHNFSPNYLNLEQYPQNTNTGGYIATEVRLSNNAPTYTTKYLPKNAYAGAVTQRSDGNILFIGGDKRELPGIALRDGRKSVQQYTPCASTTTCNTGSFTELGSRTTDRWFPTAATLADGRYIFTFFDQQYLITTII